jgi:uncharacterized protein YbaP (TraB family)
MIRRRASSRLVLLLIVGALSTSVRTAAPAKNVLWKATGRGTVVYLVGSLHLLTADFYPLSPAMETAFKDSNLLVEELDLGEMASPESQLHMLTRGMLPEGRTLDNVVSPATFELVTKRLEGIGLPVEPLKRFKPWMLAVTLLGLEWQKAGFDPSLGLDQHFYDRAKIDGKPVEGLETVDYQVARFDGMSMEQQDRMLAETLRELDTETANVTALAVAWKAGDVATIERVVVEDVKREPDMYDRLLVERNRNWLPKIEALFARPGHAFVVVGAAHLVGPDGLVQALRAKGYKIEQL